VTPTRSGEAHRFGTVGLLIGLAVMNVCLLAAVELGGGEWAWLGLLSLVPPILIRERGHA
jgi:hypothetical protein